MFNREAYALGSVRSQIRDAFEYGRRQAKLLGEDKVFDFSLGNPSIPAPRQLNEAVIRLLNTESSVRVHGYTSAPGADEIRDAVAADLSRRFGMQIRPDNLFVTCGAAPALTAVLRALSCEGSEIVAVAPFFPEYRPFIEGAGSRFVMVPPDLPDFQINLSALEACLSSHTQAVIVNSPNNPSGVVFSRATLTALADLLRRKSAEFGHPIYLISDEPYRELVYDGVTVPFLPCIYENSLVCYSWSKSLSLPGERIGYVLVPDCVTDSAELLAAVAGAARIHGHVCAPSLIQRAVAECCGVMPDLEAYDRNRRLLYEGLCEIGYECVRPQGAFYLLVRAPGGDSIAFAEKAMQQNVILVPTDAFGAPGYFRLSYCVSEDMIRRSLPVFRTLLKEG